nr:hypothetical protein [uncultured Albidiferax sp.]
MLDDAKRDVDVKREAYRAKINEFVGASAGTSTALIGLGALIAVLAASKGVHRDAILGASVIGGTGLLLGNWNLDRRRLAIYHATVAAFNCAERAAAPLNMRVVDYDKLVAELEVLTKAQTDASIAIGQVEIGLESWTRNNVGLPLDVTKPFSDRLMASKSALAASENISQAGYALADRAQTSGDLLRDAMRRIDTEADKALGDTLGDLNKVPDVIAMVAGAAGSFAPGSGVESTLTQALKKAVPAPTTQNQSGSDAKPPAELSKARAELDAVMIRLGASSAIVQNRVKAQAGRASTDKLTDCGIGEGHIAMSIDPPKIVVLTKDSSSTTVIIEGGKAPFAVKPNGSVNADVKVNGPDRMGNSFDVVIPPDKLANAQVLNYRILDSSSPARSIGFSIEVTGASAPAAASTSTSSPAPLATTTDVKNGKASTPTPSGNIASALDAINKFNKPFNANGTAVTIAAAPTLTADGKSIRIPVGCTTITPIAQDVLRTKLIDQMLDKKPVFEGVPLQFANIAAGQNCAART